MLFNVSLLLALTVFFLGLAWRAGSWLRKEIGTADPGAPPSQRLVSWLRANADGLKRPGGWARLARAVFWEGLLQGRVFRESPPRWLAHQAVFWGFVLLVLFHAFQSSISEAWLPNYYSTVNPYLVLRDVLGLLVLAGLVFFAWRRWANPVVRSVTGRGDVLILILLCVIIISGFALKAEKITSQSRFSQMVTEYAGLEEGPELSALRALWHEDYGVVFAPSLPAYDAEVLKAGRQANGDYCADCHSRPQSAFASYALSRALAPAAPGLDSLGASRWLLVLHYLACFLALACLPFSKLLHILATPLSLVADALLGRSTAEPEPAEVPVRIARRALDLSACTGCATCSEHCSVLAASRLTAGELALPSLKLAALASLGKTAPADLQALQAASDLCTRCHRCTEVCPAGIDLQDLWSALDGELAQRESRPVFPAAREALVDNQKASGRGQASGALPVPGGAGDMGVLEMTLQYGFFRYCFQCQTCSNVCPVVACSDQAGQELGLLPHQIMYSLELGLVEQAMAAAMTWDCATCYQCQEHCPQRVPVADLLYELRNQGFWLAAQDAPRAGAGEDK